MIGLDDEATHGRGAVLLTGASGFLGIHLLRELLCSSDASISCLLRGADAESARQSLAKKWSWYFPDLAWSEHEARVRILVGEITAPKLGLSSRLYTELSESHNAILNVAANVNHVGADADFYRVNTDVVATLIELARRGTPKPLHQVSTVGVAGYFSEEPSLTTFDETRLEAGQAFSNAYSESKYRAEVLLKKALAEGVTGGIYRVGFIGPHSLSGRFQQNIEANYTTRYVRAMVRLGFAPYLPDSKITLTPVDSVARAIVLVMTRAETQGHTYHVDTPHTLRQYDIVRVLHAAGYPVRLMCMDELIEKAPRLSTDEDSLSVLLPEQGGKNGHVVPLSSDWSRRELARLGFEYPGVTSAWLGKFLRHAIEVGFIEAPRFWNVAAPVGDLF